MSDSLKNFIAGDELYRRIVESANEGFWVVDTELKTKFVNQKTADIFGCSIAEMIESNVLEFIFAEDLPQIPDLRERRRAGLSDNYDFRYHLKTGKVIWLNLATSPLFDESGEFIGSLGIIRDITEALEIKAALTAAENRAAAETARLLETEAEARAAAEAANRAKDEFLSVLSHELRTPLNAMYGWVRMLRAGMLDAEKSAHAIQVIERNMSLQNSLIEDLLDVSRIISGKILIEQIPTDVAKILNSAVETIHPLAAQKNITLGVSTAPDSFLMLGDEVRLQQIFANLLNNAVKFTPQGGTITVEISQIGERVQIIICDDGIGIEKEFQPLIFDRFRQADGTTHRSYSGLGLGLTIVKHLTELHGGQISVSSDGKNCGTTFTLEFPMLKIAAVADHSFEPLIPAQSSNSVLSGKRIIIIDDNCDGLAPLEMILQMQNAEVECFDSGLHALELLNAHSYDLLVSDIGMPEIDGYELISRVRSEADSPNCRIPAIALTAYAHSEDKNQAIASGFDCHVSKPVDFDDFINAAKSLLTAENKSNKIG